MMLQVKFDFRLNFLTYGDSQFFFSPGPNSTKLKKIENQPTLKKINLKSDLTCNIYPLQIAFSLKQ